MPIHGYGNETLAGRKKKRSRIRAVQMDNLRGLVGIMRKDRMHGLVCCV